MKHTRHTLMAVLFSFACSALQANKPPPPPHDAPTMAGAWIGPLSATFHPYIRLELDSSGKGFLFLPSCTPDKEASIYRILGTTFSSGFNVKFVLEPVDSRDPKMLVLGHTEPKGIQLTVTRIDSYGSTWHWKATLLQETTVLAQIHVLEHESSKLHAPAH